MKKLILLAISQILFCSVLFAQTDNPGCYFLTSVTDATCNENFTCASAGQCPRTQFSVQCSGTIRFMAYTDCSTTNCKHCAACATISTLNGVPLLTFDTDAECDNNGFCETQSMYLASGSYIMQVCLVPCNALDGAACCSEGHNCVAWLTASSDPLTCPPDCP